MMRRSNFGSSNNQRHSVLKPRNTDNTPTARQSVGQQLKKLRNSTDGMTRLSHIQSRFTPTRSNIPKYTPVRSNVPSSSALLHPPSTSRLSVDSARNSSIGSKNRKDSRPTGEASFRNACIDKILEFLGSCSIEVTRKTLQNPITRDFVNIFTVIYGNIETNYTLPSKFEEVIPGLLKTLKYPSQITKSTFMPIGSRHTWPVVLVMLAWLIDIISIFHSSSEEVFLDAPSDFDLESTLTQRRGIKLREMYYYKNVPLEELFADYEHGLELSFEVRPQDIIELQDCEEKLEEEIAEHDKGPQRLHHLMAHYEQVASDMEKIVSYKNELNMHISLKESEMAQLKLQLDEVMVTLQQMNGEQVHLEKEKERQQYTFDQIAKLKCQAKELSDEIAQLQAKGNDLDSQIWTLQMNIGKAQKEIQDVGQTYNKGISELDLGEGFEILLGNFSEGLHDWKKTLMNLKEHKKDMKQAMYESQRQEIRKQETAAMVQDSLNDWKSQAEKLETKLRRLEEDITMTKNEKEGEEKEIETEMERLHQSILESRKERKSTLHQLQNALEAAKNDLEATKSNGKARMRAGAKFLLKVCHETLEDLDKRTKLAMRYRKDVMEYCDGLLESITSARVAAQGILEKLKS